MFEYADRFVESKVDVSVLRHLTDQDLEISGVLRLFGSIEAIILLEVAIHGEIPLQRS